MTPAGFIFPDTLRDIRDGYPRQIHHAGGPGMIPVFLEPQKETTMDEEARKAMIAELLNDETTEDRKAEIGLHLVCSVFDILERATTALEALARSKGAVPLNIDARGARDPRKDPA